MMNRLHALVYGYVQGVGYRMFVQERASRLGLTGWVRNLPDGSVEVTAEGEQEALEQLVEWLKQGPWGASVRSVETYWTEATGEFDGFRIVR